MGMVQRNRETAQNIRWALIAHQLSIGQQQWQSTYENMMHNELCQETKALELILDVPPITLGYS